MALRCLSCLLLLAVVGWGGGVDALQAQAPTRAHLSTVPFAPTGDGAAPVPVPSFWSGESTLFWRTAWGAAATTAIAYGLLHDEVVIECGAPVTGDHCPAEFVQDERSSQPHRTAGLVVGGVALVAGWLHTRGSGASPSMSEARVLPRSHGPGRVSLVRIPLQGGLR